MQSCIQQGESLRAAGCWRERRGIRASGASVEVQEDSWVCEEEGIELVLSARKSLGHLDTCSSENVDGGAGEGTPGEWQTVLARTGAVGSGRRTG